MKSTNQTKQKRTVVGSLPFSEIYENGIAMSEVKGQKIYSLCFHFSDTSYFQLSLEKQTAKMESFQTLFNTLPSDVSYKEVYIRVPVEDSELTAAIIPPINPQTEFEKSVLQTHTEFAEKAKNNLSVYERYITLSFSPKSKYDDPKKILDDAFATIKNLLEDMGSSVERLAAEQYIKLLYYCYHPFYIEGYIPPQNENIRAAVAPAGLKFDPKQFFLSDTLATSFFVRGYAKTLDDKLLHSLLSGNRKILAAKTVRHIDKNAALKFVEKRLQKLETDAQTRNANNHKNGTTYIPYHLKKSIEQCVELLNDIEEKHELFDLGLYITIFARDNEELEETTRFIKTACSAHLVSVDKIVFRQEETFNSCLPVGADFVNLNQPMLTNAAAIMLPFGVGNLFSPSGLYYGINPFSGAPIVLDKRLNLNGNSFLIGTTGSGKSLWEKGEITLGYYKYLDNRFFILDVEHEFVALAEALGGEVIKISPRGKTHINPLEINGDITDENAIALKSDMLQSLMGIFKGSLLSGEEKTIVDMAARECYAPFVRSGFKKSKMPTLKDFYECLKAIDGSEAKALSLALELYVLGSNDIFAHQTNVDIGNRLTVFDLSELGSNFKKAAMVIVADALSAQVMKGWKEKYNTYLIIDEIQTFFDDNEDEYSPGVLMDKMFARYRKRNCFTAGITQSADRLLKSKTGATMLSNSGFVVLLTQDNKSLEQLTPLLSLPDEMARRLLAPRVGEGVIVSGGLATAFEKVYPKTGAFFDVLKTDRTSGR